MPFNIVFDNYTYFMLMLGNLVIGFRSYTLLRSANNQQAFKVYLKISVVTHIAASAVFILVGSYMSSRMT